MMNPKELWEAAREYQQAQTRYYAALKIYTEIFRRTVQHHLSDVETETMNTAANNVTKALAEEMVLFNIYYDQLHLLTVDQKSVLNGEHHEHS
jgi:hypothetical protein